MGETINNRSGWNRDAIKGVFKLIWPPALPLRSHTSLSQPDEVCLSWCNSMSKFMEKKCVGRSLKAQTIEHDGDRRCESGESHDGDGVADNQLQGGGFICFGSDCKDVFFSYAKNIQLTFAVNHLVLGSWRSFLVSHYPRKFNTSTKLLKTLCFFATFFQRILVFVPLYYREANDFPATCDYLNLFTSQLQHFFRILFFLIFC